MNKVERVFKENSKVNLEDLVNGLLKERVDKVLEAYYNTKQVDFATSPKNDNKGDVAWWNVQYI